jgi:hypothetical protein
MRSLYRLLPYVQVNRTGLAAVLMTMALSIDLVVFRPWPAKLLVDNVLGQQEVWNRTYPCRRTSREPTLSGSSEGILKTSETLPALAAALKLGLFRCGAGLGRHKAIGTGGNA